MKKPNVLYSISEKLGGGGLSLVARMAGEILSEEKMLESLICYGYSKKENYALIKEIHKIYFQPAKIFSFLPSKYYYTMKRRWMDIRTAHYLSVSKANIFHGWTHSSLLSIKKANEMGKITIIERGNSHPFHTRNILSEEHEKYKIKNFFDFQNDSFFLKKFNLWRYEFDEALVEIDNSDHLFVNSEFCAKTYTTNGVDRKKITVIPRGFNPKIYSPRKMQIKKDKFIVLFVGNLLIRKGVVYILEAWEKINLVNAELWFVGTLTDEVEMVLKEFMGKFSNIKIMGSVYEPSSYYSKASVFVFPSLDEGSAKVTYESMATGLPCIFTENAGSLADKDSAYIVRTRSSDDIANALQILHDDIHLRNEMGQKAYHKINEYTWSKYQKDLIAAYYEILK